MRIYSSRKQIQKKILSVPSRKPTKAQLTQIELKYGMFIHFGINTFHDMEWTDERHTTKHKKQYDNSLYKR